MTKTAAGVNAHWQAVLFGSLVDRPVLPAAKRELGWKPTTDLDTAIRRTIQYYVNQEGFGDRAMGNN